MSPVDRDRDVRELHERAFEIRKKRNAMLHAVPTLPLSVSNSLRDAAKALDSAAADLANTYGEPIPDGVM